MGSELPSALGDDAGRASIRWHLVFLPARCLISGSKALSLVSTKNSASGYACERRPKWHARWKSKLLRPSPSILIHSSCLPSCCASRVISKGMLFCDFPTKIKTCQSDGSEASEMFRTFSKSMRRNAALMIRKPSDEWPVARSLDRRKSDNQTNYGYGSFAATCCVGPIALS